MWLLMKTCLVFIRVVKWVPKWYHVVKELGLKLFVWDCIWIDVVLVNSVLGWRVWLDSFKTRIESRLAAMAVLSLVNSMSPIDSLRRVNPVSWVNPVGRVYDP